MTIKNWYIKLRHTEDVGFEPTLIVLKTMWST